MRITIEPTFFGNELPDHLIPPRVTIEKTGQNHCSIDIVVQDFIVPALWAWGFSEETIRNVIDFDE